MLIVAEPFFRRAFQPLGSWRPRKCLIKPFSAVSSALVFTVPTTIGWMTRFFSTASTTLTQCPDHLALAYVGLLRANLHERSGGSATFAKRLVTQIVGIQVENNFSPVAHLWVTKPEVRNQGSPSASKSALPLMVICTAMISNLNFRCNCNRQNRTHLCNKSSVRQ